MAAGETIIGESGLIHRDRMTDWDPKFGASTVDVYTGDELTCIAQAAQFNKQGVRATTRPLQGPEHELRVYWPDGRDGRKIFVETWERVTEWAMVDIRNNPKLIKAAGTSETLARWYKEAKTAVKDGVAMTGTIDPAHQGLYDLLARGTEVYELKRFVLRRRRTFPPKDAAGSRMDAVETCYTTATLISSFGVPPIISNRLPANPSLDYTPSGTAWAWKSRVDETRAVLARNAGRADEVLDFVFAAWSTWLYDVV